MYAVHINLLIQGHTALDTAMERLTSKAESGQSYDLEEEHKEIRELLRREMKKLGYEPPQTCTGSHLSSDERTAGGRRSSGRRQTHQQKPAQKQVYTIVTILVHVAMCMCLSLCYNGCDVSVSGSI